jgi:hypothetical protein
MKNLQNLCAFILAALSILTVGCGGGGSSTPTTYGAKLPAAYFDIHTTHGNSSVEAWPNVTIKGWAVQNTMQCDVTQDKNCIADVGNASIYAVTQNQILAFPTNGNGEAYFGTDAITAEWNFYATDNNSTQCPGGTASYTTLTGLSGGSMVDLHCGSNLAQMVATPSSCIDNERTGVNTCTATITLSFPPPVSLTRSLPLNVALSVAVYNSSGNNLAQSSVLASTATSVVVPTPTATGTTFLAVRNPAGSVIGASEFTYSYVPPLCQNSISSASKITPDIAKCP